jgi:outer membrane protein assembly factor BamB
VTIGKSPRPTETAVRRTTTAALLAAAALAATTALAAPSAATAPFPDVIPLPDGFQPEGIASGPGTTVYAGSLRDGAIWSGDLRTGEGDVLVEGAGAPAVGVEYDAANDRLWVAGGASGEVRVYDASSGELLEQWSVDSAGFLNDVVVTADAAYVTDSQFQVLVVIPTPSGELGGELSQLPLTGDLVYLPGFNANGIEAAAGVLLIVQSNTGLLFRVDPTTGATEAVDLQGASLTAGDGIYLQGRTLYVVQNRLDTVARIQLSGDLRSGVLTASLTDPDLDIPTTATVAAGRLYAVNARFGTPPGDDTAYDIVLVPTR